MVYRRFALISPGDFFYFVFYIFLIAGLLYACYRLSRYLTKKSGTAVSSAANIKILERVFLAQDKGLAIVEVCGCFYLVGFSGSGIEILKELDGGQLKKAGPAAGTGFLDAMNTALKGRWDLTGKWQKK